MFLSRQNGTQTANLSWEIASAFISVLKRFGVEIVAQDFHLLLRKAAHVGVFMITGILLYRAISATFLQWRSCRSFTALSCTLLICAAISALDEYQKYWISGRHCQWDEALLNFIGSTAGVLLAHIIMRRAVLNSKRPRV